ncbi:transcriptional coactivator YAP1-A-like [Clytia hemisphaerica]|uniref:WW domain-containing protein n=1 Tax=Clytia hemisphaerica TaxID=252671 RepID=A0A7M5UCS4_9CNID
MAMQDPNQSKSTLHVRSDSKDALDALFMVAESKGSNKMGNASKPFRERNLPPSFFKQPTDGPVHRKTQSLPILDYGNKFPQQMSPAGAGSGGDNSTSGNVSNTNNTNQHMRQQNQANQPNHQRFLSSGNVLDNQLPPGWESRTTPQGQSYFIDHFNRRTTWDDPRKAHSMTMLPQTQQQQQGQQQAQASPQQQQQLQQSGLGPLPDGWEQAHTPEGEVYFINHKKQTTSWSDPRLSQQQQQQQQQNMGSTSPPPMNTQQSMHFMKQQQQQQQQQMLMQQQQQQVQHQHQRSGSNHQIDPILGSNSLLGNLVRDKYGMPMNIGMGIHGRGSSTDSGLDGMGTLLTPPVDDPMNMDEVDMEGNQPLNTQNQNQNQDGRLNHNRGLPDCFDSMQGTSVDIGILDNDPINSLPLSEMDIASMDISNNLTWL